MKLLLLLPLLASCAYLPPYVYTEVSAGETDMNLGESDREDAETLMFTVGAGWYTQPIPVRAVGPVRAPVSDDLLPEAEDPIPPDSLAWWQDRAFLGWVSGVLALVLGGGYGVKRYRKRNGQRG